MPFSIFHDSKNSAFVPICGSKQGAKGREEPVPHWALSPTRLVISSRTNHMTHLSGHVFQFQPMKTKGIYKRAPGKTPQDTHENNRSFPPSLFWTWPDDA